MIFKLCHIKFHWWKSQSTVIKICTFTVYFRVDLFEMNAFKINLTNSKISQPLNNVIFDLLTGHNKTKNILWVVQSGIKGSMAPYYFTYCKNDPNI